MALFAPGFGGTAQHTLRQLRSRHCPAQRPAHSILVQAQMPCCQRSQQSCQLAHKMLLQARPWPLHHRPAARFCVSPLVSLSTDEKHKAAANDMETLRRLSALADRTMPRAHVDAMLTGGTAHIYVLWQSVQQQEVGTWLHTVMRSSHSGKVLVRMSICVASDAVEACMVAALLPVRSQLGSRCNAENVVHCNMPPSISSKLLRA